MGVGTKAGLEVAAWLGEGEGGGMIKREDGRVKRKGG